MDLGIAGKKALVCGASAGLGFACAKALALEGVHVVIVARRDDTLLAAREQLQQLGSGKVDAMRADISLAEDRAAIFKAHPYVDILVTNAGGPAFADFQALNAEQWTSAINTNMLAPIALMQAVLEGMMTRGFGRIVNITSSAVKSPVDGLALSSAARLGLTGVVASIARSGVDRGVTINNILPGTFDTSRLKSNFLAAAKRRNLDPEALVRQRRDELPAKRFGHPDELGRLCAYLCSEHAGYMTGQNLLIDGGAYPGVF
jgi:3-oxoacyl-[acyl-carrier protein] reductase